MNLVLHYVCVFEKIVTIIFLNYGFVLSCFQKTCLNCIRSKEVAIDVLDLAKFATN